MGTALCTVNSPTNVKSYMLYVYLLVKKGQVEKEIFQENYRTGYDWLDIHKTYNSQLPV